MSSTVKCMFDRNMVTFSKLKFYPLIFWFIIIRNVFCYDSKGKLNFH